MNLKKSKRTRIFFLTLILVSLVIGCFTFDNQVNASTSTGFQDPSTSSGSWSNPTRAYDDGGTGYATSDSNDEQEKYGGYEFLLPSSALIVSVTVRLDVHRGYAPTADNLKLEVSIDGGTTFLATTHTINIERDWHTYAIDVTSWTSWTVDKINNDKIWVRVTHVKDGAIIEDMNLDWIPIEVNYEVLTTTTTSLSESTITLGASVTDTSSITPTISSMQPTVTFVGSGYADINTGMGDSNALFPSYPSRLEVNDLILLQLTIRDSVTSPPSIGNDFTLLYGPDYTGTTERQWIYYKFSTGSESGGLLINLGNLATTSMARIYAFRYVELSSSFYEGGGSGSGSGSTILAHSVTTTGANRLAVSFVFVADDNALGSFSGESGGYDWNEVGSEYTTALGGQGTIQLQAATMATAGTISGGSYTMGSSAPWGVRSFALKPIIPTGTVTFYAKPDGGSWNQFDSKTLTGGSATSSAYTPTIAGTWYFKAVYNGYRYFAVSSSGETDESLKVSSVITYADSDWPMFHGDQSNTGYSTSTAPSATPTLWSYDTVGAGMYSSPAVVDSVVYVGSQSNPNVYALDASTGSFKWSYQTTGTSTVRGVSSSPAVVDGVVYVGADYVYFYALDAATGAFKWRYDIGSGAFRSSPVVCSGIVYTGSTSGGLYALDATTGELKWSYATGGSVSSPAIVDGMVYVGSGDFNVYAFNALTGALKWSYPTGNYVYGSPTVVDGVVYIGSIDSKVYALDAETGGLIWSYTTGAAVYSCPAVVDGVVYIGSTDYNVYALNAATGALKWSCATGGRIESSPAVANGVLYVGSDDWSVYGIDASTGTKLWSYSTGSPIRSSPAFSNGVVYITNYDGHVFAVNAGTSSVIQHLTVSSEYGSPISTSTGDIGQGTVVTVSVASIVNGPTGVRYLCTGWTGMGSVPASGTANKVTFILMQNSNITWNWKTQYYLTVSSPYGSPIGEGWYESGATAYSTLIATAFSGIPYVFTDWGGDTSGTNYLSSNSITMDAPKTVTANWELCNPTKWIQRLSGSYIRNSPTVANGIVYAGSSYMLYALDESTGTQKWYYHTGADSNSRGGVRSSPTVVDGVVYCGSDGPSKNVYALNAITGPDEVFWTYDTEGSVYFSSPAVANGFVYIGSTNCKLFALDASNGLLKWSFQAGSAITSSPAVANGIVYFGSEDHKVYALDAVSGAVIWSYTTGHQIDFSSPAVVDGVVYIGSDDCKVYALDAVTGAVIWTYTTGGFVQSSPTVVNGVVYVGSGDGYVYALNAATGTKIWSQVTGYVRSTPAFADGVVYVSSINRNIYAFDALTGTTLWVYATGSSVYSSPFVVNGVVYVGSDDGNLYAIKAGKWRSHLTVTSAYGSPTPATGDFCRGTVVTASVDSMVEGPAGVRYVCTGWTGTGCVPASGTGTSVTFTIEDDSSITWNWKTQYLVTFAVSPAGAGSTSPSTPPSDTGFWEDVGPLSISVSANSDYTFTSWSSNTQSITFNNIHSTSTTATLNGPGTVTANFVDTAELVPITFQTSGAGALPSTETVLTIDGTSYTLSQLNPSIALDGHTSGWTNESTIPLTLTTSKTNDLLYVVVSMHPTDSVSSITSPGLTWHFRAATECSNVRVETWYAKPSTSTSTSITITKTLGSSDLNFWGAAVAFGISGVDTASPFDVSANTTARDWSFGPSSSITTTNANDFIIGALAIRDYPTTYPGNGYEIIATQTADVMYRATAEYKIVSTTGTYNPDYYVTAYWAMVADAIKQAPPLVFNWLPGSTHTIEASTLLSSSNEFSSWTNGDSLSGASGTYTTPGSATTVTANYESSVTQYEVSFHVSGLDSDADDETILTVGSTTYTGSDFPVDNILVDEGTTYSWTTPVTISGTEQYIKTAGSDGSVSATGTFSATYQKQWQVTFSQTGIDSDADGVTVLSIDGYGTYEYDEMPSGWFNDGTIFSWTNPVTAGADERFSLIGGGGISPIQIGGSINANYQKQWLATFTVNGLDVDAGSNTVLTIGSTHYAFDDFVDENVPTGEFVNDGTIFSWAGTVSGGTGKQFDMTDQIGNSPITSAGTYSASYQVQYYLTVNEGGHGSAGGAGWYDSGSYAQATLSPLTVTEGNTQYVFAGWSGDAGGSGSPSDNIEMSGPKTATATWKTQYKQTFTNFGLGSDADLEDVLTVGATTYTGSQLPVTVWVDDEASVTYSYEETVSTSDPGKQYVLTTPDSDPDSGYTVSSANTITGTYKTQYKLTIPATFDNPTPDVGDHWYDSGTSVTASVSEYTTPSGGYRYRCTGWIGEGSVPASGTGHSTTFTINEPSTITWNWVSQVELTVASDHDTPDPSVGGNHWYDVDTSVTASIDEFADEDGGIRYRCTGWSGTGDVTGSGTGHSTTFTIDEPSSITWNWIKQYQISFSQNGLDSDSGTKTVLTIDGTYDYNWNHLPENAWFDYGTIFTWADPVTVDSNEQFIKNGQSGDSPIDGATTTYSASYQKQWKQTFDSDLGDDANGDMVTYNVDSDGSSSIVVASGFIWVDNGATVTYTFVGPVASTVADKRYALVGVSSGPASIYDVDAAHIVTAHYKTQWQVSISQIGIDSGSTTVLTLDDVPYDYEHLPSGIWVDDATEFTWVSPVDGGTGKQFVKTGESGTSPIHSGGIYSATYKTQWQIFFSQSGVDSDAGSLPVLTVGGTSHAWDDMPSGWFDDGTSYSWTDPVTISGTEQYIKTAGSDGTISGTGTISATYQKQWNVSFTQTGIDSDAGSNTVLMVGTTDYAYDAMPSDWFDDGTKFTWVSPVSGGADKQFIKTGQSGDSPIDGTRTTYSATYSVSVLAYTGDTSGQYSDPVTVSATLTTDGSGVSGVTLTFTIGGQSTTAVTVAGGVASTTITLEQEAGDYMVTASCNGADGTTLTASDDFTINKETTFVEYTGDAGMVTLAKDSDTGTVRVAAIVTQDDDGFNGDLTLLTLEFTIEGEDIDAHPVSESVAHVPVNSAGQALAFIDGIPVGAYTVTVTIEDNSYWKNDAEDDNTLAVKPFNGEGYVTGGGWIPSEESINGKINFAFVVHYDKRGTPKGSFVAILKSNDGFNYRIKSTNWAKNKASLSFGEDLSGLPTACLTFGGIVQLIDRVGDNDEAWGGCTIVVDMTDGDYGQSQNGELDSIAITVIDNAGIVALQWGNNIHQIVIGGGNIVVAVSGNEKK